MTKVHHTEYKKNYKNYILSTIETDYNDKPLITDHEKIKFLFERFYSEYYCYNTPLRMGKQQAMSEWLSGLALDIEHYYNDIVELAIKMGSINSNPSDRLRNKVEQGYFDFMADIILGFEPKKQKEVA